MGREEPTQGEESVAEVFHTLHSILTIPGVQGLDSVWWLLYEICGPNHN